MDRRTAFFSDTLIPPPHSMPARLPTKMPPQQIVAWTPVRILSALGAWLMEETQIPPLALPAVTKDHRA